MHARLRACKAMGNSCPLPTGIYVTWCQRCGRTLEIPTRRMLSVRASSDPVLCEGCKTRQEMLKRGVLKSHER